MLLLNLLMALAWVALTGSFSPVNFIVGFVLCFFILWFTQKLGGSSRYFIKVPQVIAFILFYIKELVLANLRVAYSIFLPSTLNPGIIAVPLDVKTDAQIALLVNLITLTPGTVTLDVARDRSVLYIYTIDVEDADEFRRRIKRKLERRVREVLE